MRTPEPAEQHRLTGGFSENDPVMIAWLAMIVATVASPTSG